MKNIQKFSNDLFSIAVQTSDGNFSFDIETVARSLGFTQTKNGKEYIRWETVNKYLKKYLSQEVGKNDFISEPMVYKLAFKAGNSTAEQFQDWLAVDVIPQIRKTGSYTSEQPKPQDEQLTKRMNAEARLKNANARQAKLLAELSRDTKSDVNKILLQDKAVEVMTGQKLLDMPPLGSKFYSASEIAKRFGVYSKTDKVHETAVSQLIKTYIDVSESEVKEFPGAKENWSGSVTKYAETVLDKVEEWLQDNGYPTVIQTTDKNYYVNYKS